MWTVAAILAGKVEDGRQTVPLDEPVGDKNGVIKLRKSKC